MELLWICLEALSGLLKFILTLAGLQKTVTLVGEVSFLWKKFNAVTSLKTKLIFHQGILLIT